MKLYCQLCQKPAANGRTVRYEGVPYIVHDHCADKFAEAYNLPYRKEK